MTDLILEQSPLGKKSLFPKSYDPSLLFPIPRQTKRDEMRIPALLPFDGGDIWNSYELSWLNEKGKPLIALGEFVFPCHSPFMIESKSLKLYLNSFSQTQFASVHEFQACLETDLSAAAGAQVRVKLLLPERFEEVQMSALSGKCLDELDVSIDTYDLNPDFLSVDENEVEESLYSNLLRSNCLITGQPDWGSIFIHYAGAQINHSNLLKYIISFRHTNSFGEPCVERIFMDISRYCSPKKLFVYSRFTRRGGLDINPYRSNFGMVPLNIRDFRQ